ncbi:putative serine/threonine-protein kinase SBK3 isoform X2 [Carettochelys insculpta]|uniref:putative serine/threonine-protein kinase SBK3 isoform X2 n=1 Tax=Carettochelys insculpta TaxID=44489 RepID=UPI003EB6C7AD
MTHALRKRERLSQRRTAQGTESAGQCRESLSHSSCSWGLHAWPAAWPSARRATEPQQRRVPARRTPRHGRWVHASNRISARHLLRESPSRPSVDTRAPAVQDMELPEAEDNVEFLERLMEVTSRSLPQLELQEQYTVVKELGSGTYGKVLLAEHREQGTALVLKVMPKERTERRAFLREYCIALCLSAHAGFLRTLPTAFESPTHFAFAQELAPAGDLCAIEGLPEAQVKRCAAQLAEALDFMHGKALVHRDIKLDNVLLFDHECRRVKLGDFGLTQLEGTPVCAMSGTLPYAPPELCLLDASETLELDASLDVWAFGVLLFCLCTGCFPWDVAVSPDPQFEEFGSWQNTTVTGQAPVPWRVFSSAAHEMFRRLLTLDPNRRSPAIEVHKYLSLGWLVSGHQELDSAVALGDLAGEQHSQAEPGSGPSVACCTVSSALAPSRLGNEGAGGEDSAGGTGGGTGRSRGGEKPAPHARASIPCHPSVSVAPIPITSC